jgi:hypothetical protein
MNDRIDKDVQAHAVEQVDQLLLEGLNSPAEPYDKKWLQELKGDLNKPTRRRPA